MHLLMFAFSIDCIQEMDDFQPEDFGGETFHLFSLD